MGSRGDLKQELHWSELIRQISICVEPFQLNSDPKQPSVLPIILHGGSNDAKFVHVHAIVDPGSVLGEIDEGDIVLQVNDVKVGGFTVRDAESLLQQEAALRSPEVHLAIVNAVSDCGLSLDLRDLLQARFDRETPDYQLQSDVRANIHRYIIPYTTLMMEQENQESPYQHVTQLQFLDLENQNFFLESTVFEGNYYGTPCPENIAFDDHVSEIQEDTPIESHAFTDKIMELPPGWERIEDLDQNIVYYVDHINRKTQFEPPDPIQISQFEVVQSKIDSEPVRTDYFWEDVDTVLVKSDRGFGFTLQPVGPSYDIKQSPLHGNEDSGSWYVRRLKLLGDALQITEIVEGGPADRAKLKQGDILCLVNETSAINADNRLIAGIFQALSEGDSVKVSVKRFKDEPSLKTPIYVSSAAGSSTNSSSLNQSGASNQNSFDKTVSSKATVIDVSEMSHQRNRLNSKADFYRPQSASYNFDAQRSSWNRRSDIESPNNRNINSNNSSFHEVNANGNGAIMHAPQRYSAGNDYSAINYKRSSQGFDRHRNSKEIDELERESAAIDHIYASLIHDQTTSAVSLRQKLPSQTQYPPIAQQSQSRLSRQSDSSSSHFVNEDRINIKGSQSYETSRPVSQTESEDNMLGEDMMGYESKSSTLTRKTKDLEPRQLYQVQSSNGPSTFPDGQHLQVTIMKSSFGFGFTLAAIALNGYHVQVKQVLDQQHCQQLCSGDILTSINETSTRNVSKDQVVNMLKGCPVNQLTFLNVIRGVQSVAERLMGGSILALNGNGDANSARLLAPPNSRRNRDDGDFYVKLKTKRDEFGFEIRGGAEENSSIFIGSILDNTAASENAQIKSGDELLEIDGESVAGEAHSKAVWLLKRAKSRGQVVLKLRRSAAFLYDLTVRRSPEESFGFVIVTSSNKQYTKIGGIVPNSPAERCRDLQVDDRVHAVNNVRIQGLEHPSIVSLIKESGQVVTLTLSRDPVWSQSEQKLNKSSELKLLNALTNEFINTSLLSNSKETSNMSKMNNANFLFSESPAQKPNPSQLNGGLKSFLSSNSPQNPLPPRPANLPTDLTPELINHSVSQQASSMHNFSSDLNSPSVGNILKCRLVRDERVGFGFSVKGGVDFGNPINIFKIAPEGPADRSQRVKIGDVILEVNGASTHSMTHADFLSAVRSTPSQVQLVLSRASTPAYLSQPVTPTGKF